MTSATINKYENFTGDVSAYYFCVMTPSETIPPTIYNIYPPQDTILTTNQPQIFAHYLDDNSGIDISSVILLMNGDTVNYAVITDSMITATPSSPLPDTTYNMFLSVSDNAGNKKDTAWTFIVDANVPDIPVLISPADDTTIATQTPTFIWSKVTKIMKDKVNVFNTEESKINNFGSKATPVTYTLMCATDSLFNNLVIDTSGILDTSFIILTPLPESTYYWHVEGVDGASNHSGYQTHPFRFIINLSGIKDSTIPAHFYLSQARPNPFSGNTRIVYGLPALNGTGYVRLSIYDISGKLIRELVNEKYKPGYHPANWDGKNKYNQKVTSGVYFYRLEASKYEGVGKLILLR